jgi:trans-2,3-dihydro-3-hydroxyanthranilate isomerase
MLAFARETRLAETTFVQSSDRGEYRNRIWMTRREVPFAGHPSLGTAAAVAIVRGDARATYVQETPAGLQPIDVEVVGERAARASMLQEPVTFGPELDPAETLAAAGLDTGALADDALPVQVVNTGAPQVLAVVRPEALAGIRPEFAPLEALLGEHEALTFYLATVDREAGTARARAVYVDPDRTGEDPATGSAAGPLMAYLHARAGLDALRIDQGVEMGRPSVLECSVEGDRVRVGGDVVVVARGTVSL